MVRGVVCQFFEKLTLLFGGVPSVLVMFMWTLYRSSMLVVSVLKMLWFSGDALVVFAKDGCVGILLCVHVFGPFKQGIVFYGI